MKKIKLKFRNDFDRFAFYDIAWCRGFDYPQCASCSRNPKRYENWSPPGCYTGFCLSGDRQVAAEQGNCAMFVDSGANNEEN